jgi:hypothetical protein
VIWLNVFLLLVLLHVLFLNSEGKDGVAHPVTRFEDSFALRLRRAIAAAWVALFLIQKHAVDCERLPSYEWLGQQATPLMRGRAAAALLQARMAAAALSFARRWRLSGRA